MVGRTCEADRDVAASVVRSGRLPEFIIIGGMKCGSTTLYEYLCRHPRIFMCSPKEPMFFSRDDVYRKGETWYRALFAEAGEDQICGEASTCYTRAARYPEAAQRMHDLVPGAKLIYIMRHPVDRIHSHYMDAVQAHLKAGKEFSLTLEQAVESNAEYIDASMYIRQIERYSQYFADEQMCLILLDDLKANAAATLNRVQAFLGLAPEDLTRGGELQANKGDGGHLARTRINRALRRLRRLPGIRSLVDALPDGWRSEKRVAMKHWLADSFIGRRIARQVQAKRSPMQPETRQRLLMQLESATRELERFLGRKLPQWFV